MNRERLDEICKRVEAATGEPWSYQEDDDTWQLFGCGLHGILDPINDVQIAKCRKHDPEYEEYWPNAADSQFIIHARQDIPDLLDALNAAEAKLKQIAALAHEWDANKMGSLNFQRKRWLKLGEIARDYFLDR